MTPSTLLTAAVAGILVGLAGHVLMAARRRFRWWFPPTIGVLAALAGTAAVHLTAEDTGDIVHRVAAQLLFAGIGVMVMAARGAPASRHDAPGR
jgi:hypothetical protein